jgi:predicted SprT family Zn-dependent metalloprotease
MPTRWGSCTPKGKIILNPELIKAPKGCIEYVIIHELCHLIHHDHTQKFLDLQTKEMKDWEKWKMKLEKLLAYGNSRGPMPCYFVTTIRINSDSTYTRTDYKCGEKRKWRNYKKWESVTSTGTIQKEGKYYKMTEYRDNHSTDILFKLKVTETSITFWDYREEPKNKFKGLTLKRASL